MMKIGIHGFAIFCKFCGLVGYISTHKTLPYNFKCPKCGVEGKLKRRKHFDGNPKELSRITCVSTYSQAFVKLRDLFRR
jgi:hypothetical protein